MAKQFLFVLVSIFILILVGCSSSGLINQNGDVFVFGESNANWFVEIPSANYRIMDLSGSILEPPKGTAVLQNTQRKMSVTLSIKSAEGHKTAVECRDAHLTENNIMADPNSIRTYERDSVSYEESNPNKVIGYSGRFIQAYYLKDGKEFSVLVYISQFDELKDRSVSDNVFKSIVFKTRVQR